MTIVLDLEQVEAENLAFRLRVAVRLKELRKQYGLTLEDLVSILSCAPTKEQPARAVTERQLEDVERAYHVVENPPFFYTMLYELFGHDPAFNPADIPPRIQKGRGEPTLKSRAWNDHLILAWLDLYAREVAEMKTLLDVAASEGKTVDVGSAPQGLPAETQKVDMRTRKRPAPTTDPRKVAISSGPSPADIVHEWAAQAAQDFRGWLKDNNLVRARFAKDIGIPIVTLGQICVGKNIRTDIEPYVILYIRTRLPIFHPDRIPPRAIWSTDEWTVDDREWSNKGYWLVQLAKLEEIPPEAPVPPELYALPQGDEGALQNGTELHEDEQEPLPLAEAEPPVAPEQPEAGIELRETVAEPAREKAPEVSPAALQFDALIGLMTQSLIGQLATQIQQALLASGSTPSVVELVETVKTAVSEALAPIQLLLESIGNAQEQHTQQLQALINASQAQQDPGRDLSLAMRRFLRLLEDEMRKGPEDRKRIAEQLGRTLAQRLWMIDIVASDPETVEDRYAQHQIVGR